MAPEDIELVGQLLVRAGIIMEDHTGEFVSHLPNDKRIVACRIELLRRIGDQLVALAAAAATILQTEAQ